MSDTPRQTRNGEAGTSGGRRDARDAGSRDAERAADERVLREVVEGRPGAFEHFGQRFGNRIYAFGLRMCGHREDAEDVFQDTLVTVYRKLASLRSHEALTTWLYRIVANRCLSSRRRSKFAPEPELSLDALLPREGAAEADLGTVPDAHGPLADTQRREIAAAVEAAARDLPPDYRVVWLMRDVEGLSTRETAEALELPVPTIKMRLHRARLALRKQLAHLHPERPT